MADIRELILKNVFSAERFRALESRFPPLLGRVERVGSDENKAEVTYADPLTGQVRTVADVPVVQIRGLPPLELKRDDIVVLAFAGGSMTLPYIIAAVNLPPDYERLASGETREHAGGAL